MRPRSRSTQSLRRRSGSALRVPRSEATEFVALSFCNSPQMSAPEAYIQFTPGLITDDGEVTEKSTEQFLRDFMEAFAVFITRVLTVLPRVR
jgi:NAD(P)H-dependent FMN reductase